MKDRKKGKRREDKQKAEGLTKKKIVCQWNMKLNASLKKKIRKRSELFPQKLSIAKCLLH